MIGIFRSLQEQLPSAQAELRQEIQALEQQLAGKRHELELVIALLAVIEGWAPVKSTAETNGTRPRPGVTL